MTAGRARIAPAGLIAIALIAAVAGGRGEAAGRVAAVDGLSIGVMPQRPIERHETDEIADAGVDSVRIWFPWAAVESKRDELDWESLDDAVAINADAGLTTLPFLFGSPAWAAERDGRECDGPDCISFPPGSSETRYEFAQFAGAAVRRYGPDGTYWDQHPGLPYRPIRVWQIWNEPNLSSFFEPRVDVSAYAAILGVAAAEIRRRDPGAEILLGGLSGSSSTSRRISTGAFLEALYAIPEVGETFDGIAIHPYDRQTRGVIGQVRTARGVAERASDDAEIWVTELGWASAGKKRWALVKSPKGQARLLRRTLGWLIDRGDRWGVRAAYWYSWRDTDRGKAVCGWCPASGLIDRDGDEKLSYEALRKLAGD